MDPIVAFNDHGQFLPDTIPGGLEMWIDATIENFEMLREETFDNTNNGIMAWWALENDFNIQAGIAARKELPPGSDPGNPCNHVTITRIGPLLPTTWGQFCTYNDLAPSCTGNPCNHDPTGCVATAMGQVMRFWGQPSGRFENFGTMALNHGDGNVADLLDQIGDEVHMSYSCGGSSSSDNIASSFRNDFSYSSAEGRNSYVSADLHTDINSHRPCLLGGCAATNVMKVWKINLWHTYSDCHEWVCDGKISFIYCNYTTYLLHQNWGWHEVFPGSFSSRGNDFNGWYLEKNWNPGTRGFQYANDMEVEVIP